MLQLLPPPSLPSWPPVIAALATSVAGLDLDLRPPTDERPFFFNLLPLDQPHRALRFLGRPGVIGGNAMATLTLSAILLIAVALVVATIVIPLRPAIREAGRRVVTGGTLYFGLLGLGFMLVEMGLLQRLSLFLGHPARSLSVVLFSLILTAGLGSAVSERIRLATPALFSTWGIAVAAYILLLPAWLPAVLEANQAAGLWARAALCLGVIAPAGIMMGFAFPCGLRLTAAHDERPTVWFWGINGAAGVLGSVLAIALSIAFGIQATLVLGGICYLALVPAAAFVGFPRPAPRG